MTAGKIKENAETHALLYFNNRLNVRQQVIDAYIAGAHSRDEEIKEIKDLQLAYNNLVNSFNERGRELTKASQELNQLRNPWISVEERLPAEFKIVIVMFDSGIIINAFMTMVKDEPAWHPSVEIPIGSYVICWMPIPELKGGEV